jgi:hypothetical protein
VLPSFDDEGYPVVGSALNWQGQPQLQLQLPTSSPAIRHLIFVGSLIFLHLHNAPPPSRGRGPFSNLIPGFSQYFIF